MSEVRGSQIDSSELRDGQTPDANHASMSLCASVCVCVCPSVRAPGCVCVSPQYVLQPKMPFLVSMVRLVDLLSTWDRIHEFQLDLGWCFPLKRRRGSSLLGKDRACSLLSSFPV